MMSIASKKPLYQRAKRLSIWAAAVLLHACAINPVDDRSISEKIDALRANHQYGAALDLLGSEGSALDEQVLAVLREDLLSAAGEFEYKTQQQAEQLRDNDNWRDASALYTKALESYPESQILQALAGRFFQQRDALRDEILLRYRVARAGQINTELARMERIASAAPDDENMQQELQRLQAEHRILRAYMLQIGELAVSEQRWEDARRYLRSAISLDDSERAQTALATALAQIKPAKRRGKLVQVEVAAVKRPSIDRAAIAAHMRAYHDALKHGQLLAARAHLDRVLREDANNLDARKEQGLLATQITRTVNSKLEKGKRLYAEGQIDAAIKEWQLALQLAPENDALREHLEKAERFQKRYEQLKR